MRKHLLELVIIEVVFLVLGLLGAKVRTVLGETTLVWRSLGTPPGKAIRIVDGDRMAVRVETIQGKTYFCRLYSSRECWIPDDQSSYAFYSIVPTSDSLLEFNIYGFRKPPLLRGVLDKRNIVDWPSEYKRVLSIYAVTENGKVYVWQDSYDGFSFDPLIYGCQGIFIALVCGFVLWWFMERGAIRSQRRERAAQKTT